MTRGRGRPDYGAWRTVATLSSVGLTLALSVAIGVGLGLLLDHWFKTRYLVVIFTLVGVIAGFKQLIQAVVRAGAELDRKEDVGGGSPREEHESLRDDA